MIKVENLRKVYSNNGSSINKCEALKGISFNLPETGMIFICGKSGSGKSTLLNILGGLDKFTSGDIEINGAKFSKFTNADYDNYRNNDVGFIFQDFCLINSLNIEENIKFSLDLQRKKDNNNIHDMLTALDLAGLEKRHPKELSGGQQQRVSIARALIKKPSLVLADEPTGNLDSKTSVQILNLLKEMSKTNLILIVSHNLDDAYKYGDRIIELADGRIVQDIEKNNNEQNQLIDGNIINLPQNGHLTDQQIDEINNAIQTQQVIVKQTNSNFIDTIQPQSTTVSTKKDRKKLKTLKLKNCLKLSKRMSKGFGLGMITTILMASLLIIILGFSQIFTWFNGSDLVNNSLTKIDTKMFVLMKGQGSEGRFSSIKTNKLVEVTNSDIEYYYNNGYTGNIYKLYNSSIILDGSWQNNIEYFAKQSVFSYMNKGYVRFGYGVLECDENLLIELYGKNGKLNILSGNLDAENTKQLVVTDYFADCMLSYNTSLRSDTEDKYENLTTKTGLGYYGFSIKAIIDTDYETKYASIFQDITDVYKAGTLAERKEKTEKLKNSDLFIQFCDEIQTFLAIGYYFGSDYIENCINNTSSLKYMRARTTNADIYDSNGELLQGSQQTTFYRADSGYSLPKGAVINNNEAYVGANVYNSLFGTSLSYKKQENFQERTITIMNYAAARGEYDEPMYTITLTIKGLTTSDSAGFVVDQNIYSLIKETSCVPYALYFDNKEVIANMYNEFTNINFYSDQEYMKTIYQILNVVDIFSEIFLIILIALSVACVVLLMSVGLRSVKRRMYDIGVMRALGCKNRQIGLIFTIQILFIGALTCLLSIVGMITLDNLVNNILVNSMAKFMGFKEGFLNIALIQFNPYIIILTLGLVLSITTLATIIPFMAIRKIKPIKIIRKTD